MWGMKDGSQKPVAGVGLRNAIPSRGTSAKGRARLEQSADDVQEAKKKKREAIWDKLDRARAEADKKLQRVQNFSPTREREEDPLDDFDF